MPAALTRSDHCYERSASWRLSRLLDHGSSHATLHRSPRGHTYVECLQACSSMRCLLLRSPTARCSRAPSELIDCASSGERQVHGAFCDGVVDADERDGVVLCGLTFELSGRQRQDARPGLAKMYRVPPDRAWWPAVGAPLERGVRPHSLRRLEQSHLAVSSSARHP